MKLLVVATHPIQYQAPWFRALAASGLDLGVLFGVLPAKTEQGAGFGVAFNWDVPVLEGYRWEVLEHVGRVDLSRFLGLRVRGLQGKLRREQPQALLVTGWNSWMLLQALRAARRLAIPTLIRGDSHSLAGRPWWNRLLHRIFFRGVSAFLVVGGANRRLYLDAGVPQRLLFECPHFVDNARFEEAAAQARSRRLDLRARWAIPPEATCALFAGKLIRGKRPDDLLEALGQLREPGASRHLLVVGDGELRASLEQKARERSLPVTFAGFMNQSEIPAAYAASDFLVLPSASETWGLVVNEAMACAIPALVSDRVGCAQDLVFPGRTGAIHRCADIPDLAAHWRALTLDRDRLQALGAAAKVHVGVTHSVERAVEGTVRACEFVVSGRRQ